jgi:hypothetical protein
MVRLLIVSLAIGVAVMAVPAQDVKDTVKDAVKREFKKTEEKKTETSPVKTPKVESPVRVPVRVGVPGEVEINFLNGSSVRMVLESEKLEVATPYGQLAVPSKEIRAIEFGLHFPDGIQDRIQQAVKSLGAENYRDRDQAGKALIELGPYSFPAVLEASTASDLEVSRRGKELVKQLRARHPKRDLKTASADRIVTPTFTIVGQILTPTLKAKAELFGDVELPVARMRTLRSFADAGLDIDLTIDAARYANQGQWLETDFQVDGRTTFVVTAKGQVDVWPQQGGQFIVGPNGLQGRNQGMQAMMIPGRKINGPLNGHVYGGALLGKIGEDGELFTIGERYEGAPEATGKLFLHIGPSPWNAQASGVYEVKIARK